MDALLSQGEAAEILRLSERVLERYRLTGFGPVYHKLGRRIVYAPRDLQDWLDANRRRSTSECQP